MTTPRFDGLQMAAEVLFALFNWLFAADDK